MILLLLASLASAQELRGPFSDAHARYYYPTAYFDHAGRDWACGGVRYGGHTGSDFGVGGFAGMDAGRVIVAATEGRVEYVNDGEYDRCTSGKCTGGAGCGNYVKIRHPDGKATLYCHMKKWSLKVRIGDNVACGTPLGLVGSSGRSTGPHVHLSVRSTRNVSVDPFYGSCSGPPSYWISQGPYRGRPGLKCPVKDADGDGYNADKDCNDRDKRIHPGAREICDDGIDQDCKGGDLKSVVRWRDRDADGWGAEPVKVCGTVGGGLVTRQGDCDDTRKTVNPAHRELCDGIDNDCNGEIDEGNPAELGRPPPELAARLVDVSYPASLEPGEAGPVWFVFENVGSQSWPARSMWLAPAVRDQVSALRDAASWPAWDVLAVLDEEVPAGGQAAIEGQVRAPEQVGLKIDERLYLRTSEGRPVRCPQGEVSVDLVVRAAKDQAPVEDDGLRPSISGECASVSPHLSAIFLLPLVLLLRRRRP
ncbi:MAG: murein DD-endopeptidase MepM/ murein hydrolase activator NlpD [Kiritimatiellia bacterium]